MGSSSVPSSCHMSIPLIKMGIAQGLIVGLHSRLQAFRCLESHLGQILHALVPAHAPRGG